MGLNIEQIEALLLVAAVVAMLARRVRLPYTVGLVLAGAGLALIPHVREIPLTKTLIFNVLLPPLIFEAAIQIPWTELRKEIGVVTLLATLGVLLSAILVATGLKFSTRWSWPTVILLGVLLSATDPVSVIATFKEIGIKGRLRLLVESESLFNDGTVAVLFMVVLAALGGVHITVAGVCISFLYTSFGGILYGGLFTLFVMLLTHHAEDHLIEITFTTVAAYGSFMLAEHFHSSGVFAAMTAGLIFGNTGNNGILTEKGRDAVISFWEYVAFIANSLIFLLIGMRLPHYAFAHYWIPIIYTIILVILGRALAVYGCSAIASFTRSRVSYTNQHILVWGGLRGALALALVLGLSPDIPQRGDIIVVTFAVVAFSIIVQGITIGPLLQMMNRNEESK